MRKNIVIKKAAMLITALVVGSTSICHASKIKILCIDAANTMIKKIAADYCKTHKSTSITTIELKSVDSPALELAQKPDIYIGNHDQMGLIADIGIYQDLNKVMPKQTLKIIIPTFLDAFSINKKLLALPLTGWFCNLTYNTDIFASNGLSHPNKQWTWEKDFYKTCLKLSKDTNGDGIVDRWGIVGLPDNLYSSIVYSYGGSIVDKSFRKVTYTQKPTWDAINFVKRLHTENLAEVFNWRIYSETNQPFINTKSAMRFDYDGSAQGIPTYELPFKALSTAIPKGPKGSIPVSFAMGVSLMVNSPNKSEAVEFMKYLYTITGQLTSYKVTQCLPVTVDALKSKDLIKSTNPDLLKSYNSSYATSFRKDFGELEQSMWDDVLSLCKGSISEAQFRERSLKYQERLLTNTPYSMYY